MLQVPDLDVRLFLDIQRKYGDTTPSSVLVKRFAERFRSHEWPSDRPLPSVYFAPRSLEIDTVKKACLHAKCVVVDGHHVFVSSANFTEAAQERNIEIGLLITSDDLARKITRHFNALQHDRLIDQVL